MHRSKKIAVGDKEITVTELSVSQISNLLDQMEQADINTIDLLFPNSIPAVAVAESTGINIKKLEEYHPSNLKVIIDGVENLNPFFANMIMRLATVGGQVISEKTSTQSAVG